MGRWRIEDLVSPQMGRLVKQFECSICHSIWDNPVETPCCESTFCRSCIVQCAACPICRLPMGSVKDSSKAVLRLLNNIEVRCPYHLGPAAGCHSPDAGSIASPEPAMNSPDAGYAERSPEHSLAETSPLESGPLEPSAVLDTEDGDASPVDRPSKRARVVDEVCTWEGSYGDLLSKHISECLLHDIPCPRNCGLRVLRRDLEAHYDYCEKCLEKCIICGEMVKPWQMLEHRRSAAELHVQLLEERLDEERDRADRSVAQRATLEDVLQNIKVLPRTQQQHVTTITRLRAEDVKAEVKRQLRKKVVWRIKEASKLKNNPAYPKGKCLESPEFFLCGHDMRLQFFPKGFTNSDAGCSGVGMQSRSSTLADQVQMQIRYTINDSISKVDDEVQDDMRFVDWPKSRDIFDSVEESEDLVTIEAEVLSTASILSTRVI